MKFPEYPPYGGKFTEIVPHLTVANRSVELSTIAETELSEIMKELGPIHAVCNVVELYENSSGHWRWAQSFPLKGWASNNTSHPTPYCMALLCAILSLLLGCMLVDSVLKPDDKPKLTDSQSELDQNRKKWMSQMVSNYQFNFRWICFLCAEIYGAS